MTRAEATSRITTSLRHLSDEHLEVLAEITQTWSRGAAETQEDDTAWAAIANGIAQGRRGEFASDDEVAAAYGRFRK
jgi:hypothetical protein